MRPLVVAPLILLLLSALVDIASAQVPARVETPYTLIDAESRTYIEGGIELDWVQINENIAKKE